MKFVVAVSGGVDSVVLLDAMVHQYDSESLVVAHFDHGIRANSGEDALFVQELAKRYGCQFESAAEKLGVAASEALARSHRYAFLHDVARRYDAALATAHHLDDLVETVALQLMRGTGWRGLTPFGQAVERPLLAMTKEEILEQARDRQLEWREDETNTSMAYARNRIRPVVATLPLDTKRQILALYARQWELRRVIENEVGEFTGGTQYLRYFFIMSLVKPRVEILRAITEGRLTSPQLTRLAHVICVARPKTIYEAGAGVEIHFTSRHFTVKLLKLNKDT